MTERIPTCAGYPKCVGLHLGPCEYVELDDLRLSPGVPILNEGSRDGRDGG